MKDLVLATSLITSSFSMYSDTFLHREEARVDGERSPQTFVEESRHCHHTKTHGISELSEANHGIVKAKSKASERPRSSTNASSSS